MDDRRLERLSQCFGSRIATIIDRNVKTMEGSGVAIGVDAPSQVEFFTVWGTRNPFVQALKNKSPSVIDTDQDVLSKDALLASDYYNGFMRQRDMHSMLRITLQKDDELHRSISIMGPQIRGEFEKRDVERGPDVFAASGARGQSHAAYDGRDDAAAIRQRRA